MLAAQAAKEAVIARGLTWGDWVLAGSVFVGGILLGRLVRMGLSRSLRRGDTELSAAEARGPARVQSSPRRLDGWRRPFCPFSPQIGDSSGRKK